VFIYLFILDYKVPSKMPKDVATNSNNDRDYESTLFIFPTREQNLSNSNGDPVTSSTSRTVVVTDVLNNNVTTSTHFSVSGGSFVDFEHQIDGLERTEIQEEVLSIKQENGISKRRGSKLVIDTVTSKLKNETLQVPIEIRPFVHARSCPADTTETDYCDNDDEIPNPFASETASVVECFLVSTYERDAERHCGSADQCLRVGDGIDDTPSPCCLRDTPIVPDFQNTEIAQCLADNAKVRLIGERLALIGDELNARYGRELDGMVFIVLPDILAFSESVLNNAYDVFKNVANNLFHDHRITWCRIVALLSFGYRLGVALFRHGVKDFVKVVVKLVTRYLLCGQISRWIVQHGGWLAALSAQFMGDENESGSRLALNLIWGATAFTLTFLIIRSLMCKTTV